MRTACSSALCAPALSNGATFPPITIWHNTEDKRNYLIDGFHRVAAAKKAGINELPFTIKQGEFREAILYSVSLNSTHGLRRSNADKRKAVMTLLQDEEWSTWSNVAIASQCGVSEFMVRQLRKSIFDKNEDTNRSNPDESIFDKNEDTKLNNKRKVMRGGKTYVQDTTNIGKGKVKEPETNLSEDNPDSELEDSGFKPENNYPEDNHYYPEDVIKDLWDDEDEEDSLSEDSVNEDSVSYNQDNLELQDNESDNEDNLELQDNEDNNESDKPVYPNPSKPSKRRKRQKKKSRLVNPLSVGDKVTVKGNHYFAGEEGEITQISSPNSVIVAFEGNQRQFLQLSDLDLPESLQKPLLEKPQRPQKKEIVIKEGLNYFIRESDDKCRWYVELDKEIYEGLKIYQERVQAMSVNAAIMRFLENEGILLRPFPENKIIDEKPSAITSLTNDTRSKLENYISKHGESGIMKLLELES